MRIRQTSNIFYYLIVFLSNLTGVKQWTAALTYVEIVKRHALHNNIQTCVFPRSAKTLLCTQLIVQQLDN